MVSTLFWPTMSFTFNVPSTILCGAGAIAEVPAQLQRRGFSRVLLVTDDFMVKSGVAPGLELALRNASIEVAIFAGVQPDPTEDNVMQGLARFRESKAQAIV